MLRHALLALFLIGSYSELADDKPQPKKPQAKLQDMLGGNAENFIKRFDKDGDGFLKKEELPERLAESFARFDTNKDGKLDKQEVEAMLAVLRKQVAKPGGPAGRAGAEQLVSQWLLQFDKDNDGRISKEEARGPLAQGFARIDANQDGFLDRKELTVAAERLLAMRGPLDNARPDFDALDKDADGRLSREELKGTRFEKQFDAIDTNKDGKVDRKEFEAFLKKQAASKEP